MGIGHRVFIIDDSDEIIRIPYSKFERLIQKDSQERMPGYKKSRMRYVYAVLDTEKRKPVSIWRIDYAYLYFDADGKIAPTSSNRGFKEAMHILDCKRRKFSQGSNIIDAENVFRERALQNKIFWQPSEDLEREIVSRIFS